MKKMMSLALMGLFVAAINCGGSQSADQKACLDGANDQATMQACNRECARGDEASCAKVKMVESLNNLTNSLTTPPAGGETGGTNH